MTAPMIMSWCPGHGDPCDPCPPTPATVVIPSVTTGSWSEYLCGTEFTVAFLGGTSGGPDYTPGAPPYYGPPYDGYIATAADNDPAIAHGLDASGTHFIPDIEAGGVIVGSFSGSEAWIIESSPTTEIVSETVLHGFHPTPDTTDDLLVRTQRNCATFTFHYAILNGTYTLDPTKTPLYVTNGWITDPLLFTGGPTFAITH